MPTTDPEGAVRELLRGAASTAGWSDIDLPRVLSRVRSRRRARRIAIAGTGTAAAAVIATAGISTGLFRPTAADPGVTAGEPAPGPVNGPIDGGPAAGGASGLAPVEKMNPCGAARTELAPAESGLVARLAFPATAPVGGTVEGTVILTNTGSERVRGWTGVRPAMTVSENGITVWHSNGPTIMLATMIDLKPGDSMELPASFEPVRCGEEDELQESFRPDLPALEAGVYELSVIVPFTPDTAQAGYAENVNGPLATITLQ